MASRPAQVSLGYSDVEYWDRRYTTMQNHYDWFVDWEACRQDILPLLGVPVTRRTQPDSATSSTETSVVSTPTPEYKQKVLILGTGTSLNAVELVKEGFSDVTAVDFSLVVIEKMKAAHGEKYPSLIYQVEDVKELSFDVSIVVLAW
jgi:hypothetical protein